jgi:hypothetical protein
MQSSGKAKAPHAATYYHYLLFVVHFLSFQLKIVFIFTERHL